MIRRISKKRLAALGGKVPGSTVGKTVARERFAGLKLDDFRAWVRARKCILDGDGWLTGCRYENHQSDPCHVETKARGAGDEANLVPMCRAHHQEQHDYGLRSFERFHAEQLGHKTLRVLAGETWLAYEAERGVTL